MRYFFHIGYKGTAYRGWQKQVNAKSIQEKLEEVLGNFLKEKVHCIGCGRTDAGVHASQYFFHIDTSKEISNNLFFPLNRMLPSDLSIYQIVKVEQNYHAQFDATERSYNYFIHTEKNPFLNEISSLYNTCLDAKKMQEAASILLGKQDCRAVCKTPDRHNHTFCDISKVQIYTAQHHQYIRFEITANRFLKGMIRIIMQKLIEVGIGQITPNDFHKLLLKKEAIPNVQLAYPQGLYLSEIKYDFLDISPKKEHCPLLSMFAWEKIEA